MGSGEFGVDWGREIVAPRKAGRRLKKLDEEEARIGAMEC